MGALQYTVEGGRKLSGTIRPSGNKNAALPIVAAALLTDQPVTLENVPRIRDVEVLVELVKSTSVKIEWADRNTLTIHARDVRAAELDPELCRRIRASILLAAPLLARSGEVELPPPGGDVIGRRRLDTHFLALERLGVAFDLDDSFRLSTPGLRGADVFLDEPSVTATENAVTAAAAARGTTILRNAACEPHVQDLCHFLVALGASIEGIGTNKLVVEGGRRLGPARHRIGPDHIEVASFIGLAACTQSELRIADAGVEHLRSTLMGFARLGVSCKIEGNDLVVPAEQQRLIQSDMGGHVPKLEDQPWPAFPADSMSVALVTATQCAGMILIHEKMFESRLFFVDKLRSASRARRRSVQVARRRARVTRHSRRHGDAGRGALRRGREHDQQRCADRAGLRAHRRAPQRARREHRARGGSPVEVTQGIIPSGSIRHPERNEGPGGAC
jgi:UDP-N-acetylglucosamine 1-carboxyvinyltransferase